MTDEDFGQRFFDLSIDMLCVLHFSGYFRRLNGAWESTLGFTRDELMSRHFIEFVHPDDRERTLPRTGTSGPVGRPGCSRTAICARTDRIAGSCGTRYATTAGR